MPQLRANRSNPFQDYETSVFINCPFDVTYKRLFDSVVFAAIHCGFRARCALEIDDGSQVRIDKIFRIIEECRFSIHDLSRTELDHKTRLPRFNMPLELGMFLSAKRFGDKLQRRKACLILDRSAFRYQKFISDIAGQDIHAHHRKEALAIAATRDRLRAWSGRALPGGSEIHRQYRKFRRELPGMCRKLRLKAAEVTFNDFTNLAAEWLKTAA
jgi:hypothetical protein